MRPGHEQRASATCMVEMNVSEKQPVDGIAFQPKLRQSPLDQRYGRVRARVDDRHAPPALQQVDRGKTGAKVLRVDGGDAVRVTNPRRDSRVHAVSLPWTWGRSLGPTGSFA